MPMIVDPGAPQVTPPDRVVSPEGWLSAVVDPVWAGVTLSYNGATPPAARNLALNPSLSAGLGSTAQFGSGITRTWVTDQSKVGAGSVRHVHTGDTTAGTTFAIEPVSDGATVHVGVWVKIGDPSVFTRGLLHWMNGSTSMKFNELWPLAAPGPDGWSYISGSYTLAPGQTCNTIGLSFKSNLGTWWADGLMVSTDGHDYFDGSMPGAAWEGTPNASPSQLVTAVPDVADVLQVQITRTDPGAVAPVPVRSGDPAWAVEGVGTAYDHEAPLGVPVVYTATPIYKDGSTGPSTALAVTVPAPVPGEDRDLWLKSIDEPGLSLRVMLVSWPGPTAAGRQETLDVDGSPYRAVAYDVHGAETIPIVVDVSPEDVDRMRKLLDRGVLLAQTRQGYYFPDAFHVPADVTGPTPTGKLGSSEGYQFGWTIEPIERPDTSGQPLMLPGWSYDAVAQQFGTYDAVASSYASYGALSTNGIV